MSPDLAYLAFGATLVAALVAVIAFYFSRKRKTHVERAKYEMLKDDE